MLIKSKYAACLNFNDEKYVKQINKLIIYENEILIDDANWGNDFCICTKNSC